MKKLLLISILIFVLFEARAQNRIWFSSGAQTTLFNEDFRAELTMNTRFFDHWRYDKIFPELSLRYEVTKWFKPSVDYRLVFHQSRTSMERTTGHRVNINMNTDFDYDRFDFQGRVRLQYKVNRLSQDTGYEPDFDSAIRLRAKIKYNIKGSKVDPLIESEWYYNPNLGKDGRQFVKHRFATGVDINLPNKHELTVKYRYDFEFNIANPVRAHIISFGHILVFERDHYRSEGL